MKQPDRAVRDKLAAKHYPHIASLEDFPEWHRARIDAEVAADRPPPRWRQYVLCRLPSRGWLEWHLHRGIDPARRERIHPVIREAVIRRDGYVCGICGGDVEPTDIHLDHVIPYSHGGPTTVENLRVTHSRCNIRRGNRVDGA
jgi:5-methylcytosine-specific restriction endonuclease McrA